MITRILIIILVITGLGTLKVFAQDNWELKKNENGIAVYTRGIANEKLKEIRVICELPGTTAGLISVLQNVSGHADWVYLTEKATLVKKLSPNSLVYYTTTDMPWPVTDRDLVVEFSYQEIPGTKNLAIQAKSAEGYVPPKKGYVRVPYSLATWEVAPVAKDKIKIDYVFRVNPGGTIPSWLVNMAAATGPYNTFVKLREILAEKHAGK
ncbi:MAG: START domain-containing protein [Adhaeribacter sp.]